MRMDLHLQSLQLRLGQLRGESCGLRFALTKSAIVVERMSDDQSGPVNRQALVKVICAKSVVAPEYCERGIARRIYVTEVPDQGRRRRNDKTREHHTGAELNKHVSWKLLTKFKSSRQQEDQWRQHSPKVEVSQVPGENSFPRYLNVVLTRAEVSTERE